MRRAWAAGQTVRLHGLIYGLHDGLLRNLDCSVGLPDVTEGTRHDAA